MRSGTLKIIPMTRSHIQACDAMVAASEPWKTLRERIDFLKYCELKQAYVGTIRDEPAGFIIFTPEPVFARGGYLRAIGVDPALRGRGIGKKLLTFAEQKTAKRSQNLYLCVSSGNRKAMAFYKRLGYLRAGTLPDLIKKGASEYIYWKRLQPIISYPKKKQKSATMA